MKSLLKVMLSLALVFASTFLVGRLLGIFTIENVRAWFDWTQSVDPWLVFGLVVLLLFADLFIAVPTLTITVFAGLLLGFPLGALAGVTGMSLAAFCGYGISRRWGEAGIAFLVRDPGERMVLAQTFRDYGPAMILLSRAAPILPEITACMAGATRMPLRRYTLFFGFGTLPYASIAAWSGSVSSLSDPLPAILAVLGLNATLWTGWALVRWRATGAAKVGSVLARRGRSPKRQTDRSAPKAPVRAPSPGQALGPACTQASQLRSRPEPSSHQPKDDLNKAPSPHGHPFARHEGPHPLHPHEWHGLKRPVSALHRKSDATSQGRRWQRASFEICPDRSASRAATVSILRRSHVLQLRRSEHLRQDPAG